jgi:hypothetical protein
MLRFVFAIPMGLGFSSPRKTPFNSAEYRCLQSQYARISCGTCCRVRAILIIDRKSTATCNRSFDISYANSANIAYRMPESVQRLEPPEIVAFQRARVLQCDLTYTLPSMQVYIRTQRQELMSATMNFAHWWNHRSWCSFVLAGLLDS